MLAPVWTKNDKKANWLILTFSVIVFLLVTALGRVSIQVDLGFSPHIFAKINAYINSAVAVFLILALIAVKQKKYILHRNSMLIAMVLSILFLLSYVLHHLLTSPTEFPKTAELATARTIYYILLFTHIPLAGLILPFILYTAYRGLTGEWVKHRKLARITWPIWFYVAITGVIIYIMISPYYPA